MQSVRIRWYGGKWVVTDGKVKVKHGEKMVFMAEDTDATIFIPKPEMFEDDVTEDNQPVNLPQQGRKTDAWMVLRVSKGAKSAVTVRSQSKLGESAPRVDYTVDVQCPYAVYCKQGNDFAEGNTAPIMIISPP
jgi:hypothetical protein